VRLGRFGDGRIGVVRGALVHDVTAALDVAPSPAHARPSGDALVAGLARLRPRLEAACESAQRFDLASVQWLSPVAKPPRVIAVRTNYGPGVAGGDPDLFLKAPSSVVGPSEGIELRFPGRQTDHEVELVAVVGRDCGTVEPASALDCLAGYCIGIDVTLRGGEDRGLRKSLDGFTVLGPWLTTADEAGEAPRRRIELAVNGERRQQGDTSQMRHGVAELVSFASRYFTLRPGDVIMTGTPAGVGPLEPCDAIDCWIEGLGEMHVSVRGPRTDARDQR
jgi:2-keto-4-pentenoate hydratase/2-oxohepta-3-ene-1,7-dioic acid hydratase in catechol pathway